MFSKQSSSFSPKILVIDDDEDILSLFSLCLEKESFHVSKANSLCEAKEKMDQVPFDAVLLDIFLGKDNGFDLLYFLVSKFPEVKTFVMTAQESVTIAVHAMEHGATTFVSKNQGIESIIRAIKEKLNFDNLFAHTTSEIVCKARRNGMIGLSPCILNIIEKIDQVKDMATTVLINGETGTGKELIAKALHNLSARHEKRFEAVNCSAIPESLLEAELFGYRKGAFTDAKCDRPGLFQICDHGTLFLDEIGDMPLNIQAKVLRTLQEKEVRPLGSEKSFKVNTRVIAATHADLKQKVSQGRFRQDLFYRVSVLPIEIPPLRDRIEDIPLLVEHFVKSFAKQYNKQIKAVGRDLMARLKAYSWPGNIRELKNSIERAVVLTKNDQIMIEHIFTKSQSNRSGIDGSISSNHDQFCHQSLGIAKEDFEKKYLIQMLTATNGNIAQVARLSGKYRSDIYRLIDRYQIKQREFRFT